MKHLNYQHLLYFWTVARAESVTKASKKLLLSPSTLSTQIRTLESVLGVELFDRSSKRMVLTEMGKVVYRYAEDIFTLGRELLDRVEGYVEERPRRLEVGLGESIPKLVATKLLEPAFRDQRDVQLSCHEKEPLHLLTELTLHRLDVVILDAPADKNSNIQAFSHLLGESEIWLFGTKELKDEYGGGEFPYVLDQAPLLLPAKGSNMRRSLDDWFEEMGIRPKAAGEFANSVLMKTFGERGLGIFPCPAVIATDICRQYNVEVIAKIPEVKESYWAISSERRLNHPGVKAIAQFAREQLFADSAVV